MGYLKLLAELDLLKGELEDDEDISIGESASLNSFDGSYKSVSKSDGSSGSEAAGGEQERPESPRSLGHSRAASVGSLGAARSELSEFSAEIVAKELAREGGTGKQFVNYVVAVKRKDSKWQILRRYSDFFYFYQTVVSQYSKLAKIPFPGKKTFGNLERNVVEKRKKMLSEFLRILLGLETADYPGLLTQVEQQMRVGQEPPRASSRTRRALSCVGKLHPTFSALLDKKNKTNISVHVNWPRKCFV